MFQRIVTLLAILTISGQGLAGSANTTERVAGSFTAFDIEHDGDDVTAVHFLVGDQQVVADENTEISGGNAIGPAVLLTLAQFAELADHRDLSGVVEGVPGDATLFAQRVLIDPFDIPGDLTELSGPFSNFAPLFEGDDLTSVDFLVNNVMVTADQDTRIALERAGRGRIMLRLGQFLELANEHDLSGDVRGLLDDGVLHALAITIDPLRDIVPEPVVVEGLFTNFQRIPTENLLPNATFQVGFEVDGQQARAGGETEIVLAAPTLAIIDGEQLTLRQFLLLGTSAQMTGRVEGRRIDGVLFARHILITRIERENDIVDVAGRVRSCDFSGPDPVLRLRLAHSDRVIDLIITDQSELFFLTTDEELIPVAEVERLCNTGLVLEVRARGQVVPSNANDRVHLLVGKAVFQFVRSGVHGRFQGGEVDRTNGIIAILIGLVTVQVDVDTNISLADQMLTFAQFADLVESNELLFAHALGALRTDGSIQAFRLELEETDQPLVDVDGRLLECTNDDPSEVMVGIGDAIALVAVGAGARIGEKRGDAVAPLTLGEFVEKCNDDDAYRFFGVGTAGEPPSMRRVVIAQHRLRVRGVFNGGEVDETRIVIGLGDRTVHVLPATEITGVDGAALSFEAFAELTQDGMRHRARVFGVLQNDRSVRALRLELRERANIDLSPPVAGERALRGRGEPGSDVTVFDSANMLLASGATDVIGELSLTTSRSLMLDEQLTVVSLGVTEEVPEVAPQVLLITGFE